MGAHDAGMARRVSELQSKSVEGRWSDIGDNVGLSANEVAASYYEDEMPSRYDTRGAQSETHPIGASPEGVGLITPCAKCGSRWCCVQCTECTGSGRRMIPGEGRTIEDSACDSCDGTGTKPCQAVKK